MKQIPMSRKKKTEAAQASRRRLVIGVGVFALGAMAAMYPYEPETSPAPMDGIVAELTRAPSFGINSSCSPGWWTAGRT